MQYIHIFNAGHEAEIIFDSPSYTPPNRIVKITNDLAILPIWYIDESSFILSDNQDVVKYSFFLKNNGFVLPSIISTKSVFQLIDFYFIPWGISKNIIHKYQRIAKGFGLEYKGDEYSENLKTINSRKFSIDILNELKSRYLLNSKIYIPKIFTNFEELEKYIKSNKKDYLIKSPFSSSGIGLIWIRNNIIEKSERQIIMGILRRQGYVIVENVYNKIKDFAIEFFRDNKNKKFSMSGISLFVTNSKGAYIGNHLKNQDLIIKEISKYVNYSNLEIIIQELEKILNKKCINTDLRCIGVDMIIAQDLKGNYFIHPCIEVNPRFNMGFLSIKFFEKFVKPSQKGIFEIKYGETIYLEEFIKKQTENYPLILEKGKIISGFLPLTNLSSDTNYLAWVKIEE